MQYALQTIESTYASTLGWAQWAESFGLDAFAIPDHLIRGRDASQPAVDSLTVMAGLARETSTIELVLLVSPVTWRHPAVLAKTVATLQEMSGGRVTLGVGTGWMEKEHTLFGIPLPEQRERFDMLEEALGYLRAAFDEPPRDFEGEHYRFEAFDMQPRPGLRLLVGGTGTHRTPRLAGTFADEFNAHSAPFKTFIAKVERARESASEAGRDPNALLVSSSGLMVAGDDEAEYRERLESLSDRLQWDPNEAENRMAERNTPHGTWDRFRETLAGYEETGVNRFYLQAIGDTQDDVARALERLRD